MSYTMHPVERKIAYDLFLFFFLKEQIQFISKHHTSFLINYIDYISYSFQKDNKVVKNYRERHGGKKKFSEMNFGATFLLEVHDHFRRGR